MSRDTNSPFVPAIQLGIARAWQPIANGTTEWWRTTRQFGHTPPHDGSLRLMPEVAMAGRRLELSLTYTAGPKGIDAWGHLAVEVPLAGVVPNNVRATCSDPRVVPQVTVSGSIVDVLLKAAPLREGETLTITVGDDSRYVVPPSAPPGAGRYTFWAAVDADNSGVYRQVPDPPALDVRGGAAAHLRVTAPSTVPAGEPFDLHVVAADRHNDNPDAAYRGRVRLSCAGDAGEPGDAGDLVPGLTGPLDVMFACRHRGIMRVARLQLARPGTYRITAVDAANGLAERSNPIRVLPAAAEARLDEGRRTNDEGLMGNRPQVQRRDTASPVNGDEGAAPLHVYWGDLHAHNEHCDGKLSIEEFYRWGRDVRRLDFLALTNHVEGAKRYCVDDFWPIDQRYAREWNRPGRFVTFLAYEWGSWDQFGDKCVYYLDDDQPYYAADNERTGRPDGLWRALAEGSHRAITIPHHSRYGGPTDWRYRDDRLQPVVEICQMRGSMERGGPDSVRSVQYALSQGFRLGFIGSSDNHNGHPGNGALAAVLVPELTREALFTAHQARRCYATTGARILVDFRVNGHIMGEEFTVPDGATPRTVTASVAGTAEIERITVIKDNVDVHVIELEEPDAAVAWTDDAPLAGTSYYYLRVEQRDGEMAWASPVWVTAALP